jgi:hypothetical protein
VVCLGAKTDWMGARRRMGGKTRKKATQMPLTLANERR